MSKLLNKRLYDVKRSLQFFSQSLYINNDTVQHFLQFIHKQVTETINYDQRTWKQKCTWKQETQHSITATAPLSVK